MGDSLDSIFKAYDVRGIYPDEIDESVARRIGNAFVAFTNAARVLVARDARPSSEPLTAAFIEGATVAGADVIDLGFASTDLAYFAAGIGAGLTIMGGAAGIGRLAAAAMEGIARQPNAAGDIRGAMIVAAGLIEGVTFFSLIVTILLAIK